MNLWQPKPVRRLLSIFGLFAAVLFVTAAVQAQTQEQDSGAANPPPPPSDSTQQEPATESSIRAVRISDIEGKVQVFTGDQLTFDQAQQNMPVVEGMRIATGDDGRAEIELEDGGVVRVAPNSSITFSQLKRTGDGATVTQAVTQIDAGAGLSYYELNGKAGQYSVHFGHNTVTPTDSAVFRLSLDGTPAELAVMHGTVHVEDGQQSADLHTNQSLRCGGQEIEPYTTAQSVVADSWDQWNSDRDQALAQMDASETTARASSGNPDDPGWSDLDYYGDWYNIPGYGQAWSPSGTSAGWDPFGNGSWGYYSGVGYSWISGYNWGWWPYHCGAWSWLDGFGWLWFPGNCGWGAFGGGWYPYSAVWRVPHGYHPPIRPLPIRPVHGLAPARQPLVAVNRGGQFSQGFRTLGSPKPTQRDLSYGGQTIAATQATIHPRNTGPLGEGFTAAAERTNPLILMNHAGVAGSGARGAYTPPGNRGTGYSYARPAVPAQGGAPHYSGGGAVSAPRAPSGGGGGGGSHPSGGGGGSPHH
jgi:hypothetical protein